MGRRNPILPSLQRALLSLASISTVMTMFELLINFDGLVFDFDARDKSASDVSTRIAILLAFGVVTTAQIVGVGVNDQSPIENAVRLVIIQGHHLGQDANVGTRSRARSHRLLSNHFVRNVLLSTQTMICHRWHEVQRNVEEILVISVYLDVTEITNMTVRITGSSVVLAGRVEMRSDLVAIGSQLVTFVHVHAVHARLQAIDGAADLYRAAGRSLLENDLSVDFAIHNRRDSAARSFNGLASATADRDHYLK